MALLLDVSKARPYDPAALRAALRRAGLPGTVAVTPLPSTAPRMRLHHWALGDGSALLRLESTGVAVSRRAGPPGRMAVAVISPGEWTLTHHGAVAPLPDAPTLVAVDADTPFDFRRTGTGTLLALHFDPARLALPPAVPRLGTRALRPDNALYDLVTGYLENLATVASTAPELLPELHGSSIDLVRALLLTAAGDPGPEPAEPEPLRRIRRYIEEHLDDPALCAEGIAAAHNVSLRQLYKQWSPTGVGLAEHIIARRLERARETLRTHRHLTVSAVARRHGFSDPTHFARRFRAAYAVSPSRWRDEHAR